MNGAYRRVIAKSVGRGVPRPGAWLAVVCGVGVGLVGVGGALAQTAQPTLDEVVEKLGSADVRVRETATDVLASDERFTSTDLAAVVRRTELSVEQQQRLLEAARQRFMSTPRAALGVKFSIDPLRDRVVIETTYAPFQSVKLLEPGDIIVEVEGVSLRGPNAQNQLGGHIISHDPGDMLAMVVRRAQQKLSLQVQLGRFSDLPNSTIGEYRMNLAWEIRSRDLRVEPVRVPISPGIPREQWQGETGMNPEDVRRMRFKMQMPQGQRTMVLAGGRARGSAIDMEELQRFAQQGRLPGWLDPRIQQRNMMAQQGRATQGQAMTLQHEEAQLDLALKQHEQRLPTLTDPMAREKVQESIRILLKQLSAIQAEAAEEGRPAGAPPDGPPDGR